MEEMCGGDDIEEEWVDNGTITDPHSIIGDISPSDIEIDSAEKAAAHDSRVRQW